tara:strand:- start:213 stop:413 length:201 start_codon:yes stop_codon:yes gene_type:complete
MGIIGTMKLAAGSVMGIIILTLWFFGGAIGCIIGVVNNEAIYAVASLLVPGFGAIYTIVSAFQALF